jgi:hypothetical protein
MAAKRHKKHRMKFVLCFLCFFVATVFMDLL